MKLPLLLLICFGLVACADNPSNQPSGPNQTVQIIGGNKVSCEALNGWSASNPSFAILTTVIYSCSGNGSVLSYNETVNAHPDAKLYRGASSLITNSIVKASDCTMLIDGAGNVSAVTESPSPNNQPPTGC